MRVMTRPQHTKPEVSVTQRLSQLFLVKSFFRMSFYEWTHTTYYTGFTDGIPIFSRLDNVCVEYRAGRYGLKRILRYF